MLPEICQRKDNSVNEKTQEELTEIQQPLYQYVHKRLIVC